MSGAGPAALLPGQGVPGQDVRGQDARSGPSPLRAERRTAAPPLVELERVSVRFAVGGGFLRPARMLQAVSDVSLSLGEGETLGLVGESGSGKSTLGNVVSGLQPPSEGVLRFRGRPADRPGRAGPTRAVQVVFQDPFGALDPRMPVSAIVSEPLRIAGLGGRAERRSRAQSLLAQVGLGADALDRYPHEFSGGQRQRIAIARALAPDPALIVADEPLSALDVSIQSQVLNLLRELQDSRAAAGRPLSYLLVSHDLAVVNHLVDRVAVLYLGRLVEVARREALFATPSHPYTRALLDAAPRIRRRGEARRAAALGGEMPSPLDPPPGCVFHPRCPKAQAVCREQAPALEPSRDGQWAACHFKD